ncbi:MAG: AAA family ATPase [Magnetococcales bacterium]|nr:AAA family ATPase [Magnetococcales bacterium]
MYYEHFGLNHNPFRNTPDTRIFFTGGKRGAILEALEYAISQGEGILKVVGEVGSGKTTICRMLETRLADNVETVFLANPSLTPENIFHAIAVDLRIPHSASTDKLTVMQLLQEYLLQRHSENKQVVVLIEEAQGMPLATLEEIRLLSNLETRHSKLLQLVLFGQPELDVNLSVPSIRQLRERISYQFYLSPFAQDEVQEYLLLRLRGAGYRGPNPFSTGAMKKIRKLSNGLSRRINLLADKSLLAAFIEKKDSVSAKHVEKAAAESSFVPIRNWHNMVMKLALLLVVAIPIAGWIGYQLASKDDIPSIFANSFKKLQEVSQATAPKPSPAKVAPPASSVKMRSSADTNKKIEPLKTVDIQNKPIPTVQTNTTTQEAVSQSQDSVVVPNKIMEDPQLWVFLNQRIKSTQEWLEKSEKKLYTIQLMMASSSKIEWLKEVFAAHGSDNRIFYIRSKTLRGNVYYFVYLNEYNSFTQARNDIEGLSAFFSLSGPFVAEISEITKAYKAKL